MAEQSTLPPEHYPQRKCRCTDCGNIIYGHTACYRVNNRNVCRVCGPAYRFNSLSRTWTTGRTAWEVQHG